MGFATLGRTTKGTIALGLLSVTDSGGHTFETVEQFEFSEEEARWLRDELNRILGRPS